MGRKKGSKNKKKTEAPVDKDLDAPMGALLG